jgi:hypothetical protein
MCKHVFIFVSPSFTLFIYFLPLRFRCCAPVQAAAHSVLAALLDSVRLSSHMPYSPQKKYEYALDVSITLSYRGAPSG